MPVLIRVTNSLNRETVFAQAAGPGCVREVRSGRREEAMIRVRPSILGFQIRNRMRLVTSIQIKARLAALVIVAAPVHSEINKAVAVEIRWINVDFILRRSTLQVAAVS